MKKSKIIKLLNFVCILLFLVTLSCVVTPKPPIDRDKILMLEQELTRWETFKLTGMTELQYQAFSIRGQVIMAKYEDKFRFDILNQGILGLGGGVLMAFYVDKEQAQTRMFGSSSIETYRFDTDDISLDMLSNQSSIGSRIGDVAGFFSENLFQAIYSQREKILENNKAEIEGFEIIFNDEMRLSEISHPNQNIGITFIYDRQLNLTELRINTPITRNFIIHVDKIEHENIIVQPLR